MKLSNVPGVSPLSTTAFGSIAITVLLPSSVCVTSIHLLADNVLATPVISLATPIPVPLSLGSTLTFLVNAYILLPELILPFYILSFLHY